MNAQHEKRQRQFDRLVDDWKRKVSDIQNELDNAQKESRSNAAETYKFKGQLEEANETIEVLRRENKNLSGNLFQQVVVNHNVELCALRPLLNVSIAATLNHKLIKE